jgi:hypothetical protein
MHRGFLDILALAAYPGFLASRKMLRSILNACTAPALVMFGNGPFFTRVLLAMTLITVATVSIFSITTRAQKISIQAGIPTVVTWIAFVFVLAPLSLMV